MTKYVKHLPLEFGKIPILKRYDDFAIECTVNKLDDCFMKPPPHTHTRNNHFTVSCINKNTHSVITDI